MAAMVYVPAADLWESIAPQAAGADPALLAAAIALHQAHETDWPETMYLPDGRYVGSARIGDRSEHAAVIGPVRPRGAPNGLVLRGGRIVAEWGDTRRTDMTFSVTKSYLGLLAGLALADGLIRDIDATVASHLDGSWFTSPHNAPITWRHLLTQTSEWQGELWGKPDSADHNRVVGGAVPVAVAKGEVRALAAPGAHFEYNDVRVNLLAACLTRLFRRPLPEVLRERVMAPIGASTDWEWHGYGEAFVEVDGGADRFGVGRRPLGRRHVHRQPRPCADGAAGGAARGLGRATGGAARLGVGAADAVRAQPALRVAVVAERC